MTISVERTEQHAVVGFGEYCGCSRLQYVDICLVY